MRDGIEKKVIGESVIGRPSSVISITTEYRLLITFFSVE